MKRQHTKQQIVIGRHVAAFGYRDIEQVPIRRRSLAIQEDDQADGCEDRQQNDNAAKTHSPVVR